jgi:hypothetical protein
MAGGGWVRNVMGYTQRALIIERLPLRSLAFATVFLFLAAVVIGVI